MQYIKLAIDESIVKSNPELAKRLLQTEFDQAFKELVKANK